MTITYDSELIIVYNNENYYVIAPTKKSIIKDSKIIFS